MSIADSPIPSTLTVYTELSAMYLQYYVYAYLRTDGTPYYIGKGKSRRAYENHRIKNKGVHTPKDKSRIVFLETNLTNIGSLALERRYIKWYGRKDLKTGILLNKTDGGEGGENLSEKARQKIINANLGKRLTEETRQKISNSKKGKIISDDTRKKISESKKGIGLPHSEETCKKISMSKKGKPMSEEQKEKIRQSRIGKKYSKKL